MPLILSCHEPRPNSSSIVEEMSTPFISVHSLPPFPAYVRAVAALEFLAPPHSHRQSVSTRPPPSERHERPLAGMKFSVGLAAFLVAFLATCASGQWYNFLSQGLDSLFKPIFEGPPPSFQEWQQERFQEHVQVHSVEV